MSFDAMLYGRNISLIRLSQQINMRVEMYDFVGKLQFRFVSIIIILSQLQYDSIIRFQILPMRLQHTFP